MLNEDSKTNSATELIVTKQTLVQKIMYILLSVKFPATKVFT